jgi:hypothetical protein
MSWLTTVQRRIFHEILLEPRHREQLREALLWRGFPVWQETGHLYLPRTPYATTQRDYDGLRQFAVLWVLMKTSGLPCGMEIRWRYSTNQHRRETLENILRLPSPAGMTGILDHPTFGWALPTEELDQGVALLVRAIQLREIRTKISGHGNDRCRLFVEFADEAGARAFRAVFEGELVTKVRDPGMFRFAPGPLGTTALWVGDETDDEEEAFRFFRAAQELALMEIRNLG